jgi:hypothetical protein
LKPCFFFRKGKFQKKGVGGVQTDSVLLHRRLQKYVAVGTKIVGNYYHQIGGNFCSVSGISLSNSGYQNG